MQYNNKKSKSKVHVEILSLCLFYSRSFSGFSREEWFSVKFSLGLDFPNVSIDLYVIS